MTDTFHDRSRESLIEEIRELRSALEPFECEAKEWPAHTGTFDNSMNASRTSFYTTKFTAEDLRAARQALEPKP